MTRTLLKHRGMSAIF
jgi:hypothetical protein